MEPVVIGFNLQQLSKSNGLSCVRWCLKLSTYKPVTDTAVAR